MSGANLIEFEWSFTPPGFFEERSEVTCDGRTFVLDAGQVLTRVESNGGQAEWQALAVELSQLLRAQLLGAQTLSHEKFTLSEPKYARIRPDGGRDVFITAKTAAATFGTGRVDIIATDAMGNIVRDTKRERINRRVSFAQSAAAHAADPIVDSILRSYGAAVDDPDNELIHLYEIRDALADRFQGEDNALTTLGVQKSAWKRLGELANSEPILQGRHRGRHLGQLRSATEAELQEARSIAQAMISAYIGFLDVPKTGSA